MKMYSARDRELREQLKWLVTGKGLIRRYVRVWLRFYSKDQPYYEVSGSVHTFGTYVQVSIRVNQKNHTGRACVHL